MLVVEDRIINTVYYTTGAIRIDASQSWQRLRLLDPTPLMIRNWYQIQAQRANTIIITNTPGIPSVYYHMRQESIRNMRYMSASFILSFPNSPIRDSYTKASASFYAPPRLDNHTVFGLMMTKISTSAANNFLFYPRQLMMYLYTYSRHILVSANTFLGCCIMILAGNTETGKSHACVKTFASACRSVSRLSDTQSGQSDITGGATAGDNTFMYQDELCMDFAQKGTSDANQLRRQTLHQRGYVITHRTEIRGTEYVSVRYFNIRRSFQLGGTNDIHRIPPALASRASIVSVPPLSSAEKRVSSSMATRLLVAQNIDHSHFLFDMQTRSALAERFWSLHAFGLIHTIDTTLMLVFQSLLEQFDLSISKGPRTINNILNTAIAFMVMDLIYNWYANGMGKSHAFDVGAELQYYDSHSIVRMEHIICAYYLDDGCTSMRTHEHEIGQIIKELIRYDINSNMPILSSCGEYCQLGVRSIKALIGAVMQRVHTTLGSLGQTLFDRVLKSSTMGRINIKTEYIDNVTHVYVNTQYIVGIICPVDRDILKYLQRCYTNKHTNAFLSYDEESHVFGPGIINNIYTDHTLSAYTRIQLSQSIELMQMAKSENNKHLWSLCQTAYVCSIFTTDKLEHTQLLGTPVPMTTIPNHYKLKCAKLGFHTIHKSLFAARHVDSHLHELYIRAMLIAGSHKAGTNIYLGPSMSHHSHASDTFITIPVLTPQIEEKHTVQIRNHYYQPSNRHSHLDGPIGGDTSHPTAQDFTHTEAPTHHLFPPHNPTVEFSPHSHLEKQLFEYRFRSNFPSAPLPEFHLDQ